MLEDTDYRALALSALRRHRNTVVTVLRRGVPEARRPGLEAYRATLDAELRTRAAEQSVRASEPETILESLDLRGLCAEYRRAERRCSEPGVSRPAEHAARWNTRRWALRAALVLTPAQWGWLRRTVQRAQDLETDLGAQDLEPAERRKLALALLQCVRTGWTRASLATRGSQHPAARRAAVEAYCALAAVADRALVEASGAGSRAGSRAGSGALREAWLRLFLEYDRALPEGAV